MDIETLGINRDMSLIYGHLINMSTRYKIEIQLPDENYKEVDICIIETRFPYRELKL